MPTKNQKLFKFHVANNRSVEIALKNTSKSARIAIADNNLSATRSFVSLYALLLGAWAENRLNKILYEDNGFSDLERAQILTSPNQFEKWKKTVELSFRKHYRLPSADLEKALAFTPAARYKALLEMLELNLRAVIEVRNKLAHGQWIYPLNSNGDEVETSKFDSLQKENIAALQYKMSMLVSLSDLTHDLVVSLPTFDRDFDKNFNLIVTAKNNLNNRSYEKYKNGLIQKRRKGIQLRKPLMSSNQSCEIGNTQLKGSSWSKFHFQTKLYFQYIAKFRHRCSRKL